MPHFNFRTELLKIVVARVSRQTIDDGYVKCRAALETLFREDDEGQAGLEAMTMISKVLKTRHYQVHPSVNSLFESGLILAHPKFTAFTITERSWSQSIH